MERTQQLIMSELAAALMRNRRADECHRSTLCQVDKARRAVSVLISTFIHQCTIRRNNVTKVKVNQERKTKQKNI